MPDYIKTGPFVNGGAPGISATFLNNVENVFVQPSGGTETGHYFLAGPAYTTGAFISDYVNSLSRGATPLSASTDLADAGLNNLGATSIGHLTSGGFQIFAQSVGANINCFCGGNYTIQY